MEPPKIITKLAYKAKPLYNKVSLFNFCFFFCCQVDIPQTITLGPIIGTIEKSLMSRGALK